MEKMSRVVALKTFFSAPEKPVGNPEFMAFRKACSEDEREQYAKDAARQLGVELAAQ